MKQRGTRQLAATYEALSSAADHPTADQVFQRVRRALPRVSLGTVYRNLEKLREQGRLRVVRLGSGVAHYDAMVRPHDHFLCEECGEVRDLESSGEGTFAERLAVDGSIVRWESKVVYGLCPACAHQWRAEQARRGGENGSQQRQS